MHRFSTKIINSFLYDPKSCNDAFCENNISIGGPATPAWWSPGTRGGPPSARTGCSPAPTCPPCCCTAALRAPYQYRRCASQRDGEREPGARMKPSVGAYRVSRARRKPKLSFFLQTPRGLHAAGTLCGPGWLGPKHKLSWKMADFGLLALWCRRTKSV